MTKQLIGIAPAFLLSMLVGCGAAPTTNHPGTTPPPDPTPAAWCAPFANEGFYPSNSELDNCRAEVAIGQRSSHSFIPAGWMHASVLLPANGAYYLSAGGLWPAKNGGIEVAIKLGQEYPTATPVSLYQATAVTPPNATQPGWATRSDVFVTGQDPIYLWFELTFRAAPQEAGQALFRMDTYRLTSSPSSQAAVLAAGGYSILRLSH